MATRRTGKPYVYVTWLAKILGGQQCVWKAWFAAHYRYDKFEEMAGDLVQWNREHNELMRARVRELQREGFTVTTEEQNAFKLEGECAVVAGKPDIVATKPGIVLVVDGKTGRQRESDLWQVIFYLFAWPKCRSVNGELEGEVQYKRGNERISLTASEVTPERIEQMTQLIRVIASDTPPAKVPSRSECSVCNIGPTDCPQRVREERPVAVGEF